MIKALPNQVYSPDHLHFCIEELTLYAAAVGKALRSKKPIPEAPTSAESQALLELLPATSKLSIQEQLQQLVSELESLAAQLPVVHITLVSPAPYSLKQELVGWIRTNLNSLALVAFHANPDVAGGLIVRAGNATIDESFRSRLQRNPASLTEILANV
ncbi:hypothetical protein EPO04_03605 [Patescibacteria group bacterium]|nr:MAG: hypothetical protein EPO04_03605 [Patescibacteria group bacterium]